MDNTFKEEAIQVIAYLNDTFTSHEFLQIYTMGFTISYLKWLKQYHDVALLHRTIGGYLLDHENELGIRFVRKIDDSPNIFDRENDIAMWKKVSQKEEAKP